MLHRDGADARAADLCRRGAVAEQREDSGTGGSGEPARASGKRDPLYQNVGGGQGKTADLHRDFAAERRAANAAGTPGAAAGLSWGSSAESPTRLWALGFWLGSGL